MDTAVVTLQEIQWKDTGDKETVYFGIEPVIDEIDDQVFFWIESMEEIEELKEENNGQDFIII